MLNELVIAFNTVAKHQEMNSDKKFFDSNTFQGKNKRGGGGFLQGIHGKQTWKTLLLIDKNLN